MFSRHTHTPTNVHINIQGRDLSNQYDRFAQA